MPPTRDSWWSGLVDGLLIPLTTLLGSVVRRFGSFPVRVSITPNNKQRTKRKGKIYGLLGQTSEIGHVTRKESRLKNRI
jgi:hypothetical protein